MKEFTLGVSLLFKENNLKKISGVLKSLVLTVNRVNIEFEINIIASEIADFYDYKFIGINDVFYISGYLEQGAFLGRTTYYELYSKQKAKSIVSKKISFNDDSASTGFNCSLVYFCSNIDGKKFTISVVTILISCVDKAVDDASLLANSKIFIGLIIKNSVESIKTIEYLGIDEIGETDFKFNVFQTFYADFSKLSDIKKQILSDKELRVKLAEILKT